MGNGVSPALQKLLEERKLLRLLNALYHSL